MGSHLCATNAGVERRHTAASAHDPTTTDTQAHTLLATQRSRTMALLLRSAMRLQRTAVSSTAPALLPLVRSLHVSACVRALPTDRASSLRRVSDVSARPSPKGRALENSAADARAALRAEAEAAQQAVAAMEEQAQRDAERTGGGRRSAPSSTTPQAPHTRGDGPSTNVGSAEKPMLRRPRRAPGPGFDPSAPREEKWPETRIAGICRELLAAGREGRPIDPSYVDTNKVRQAHADAIAAIEKVKQEQAEAAKAAAEAAAAGLPLPDANTPPPPPSTSPSAVSSNRVAKVEYAFPKLNSFERHLVHKTATLIGGAELEHGSIGIGTQKIIVLRYVGLPTTTP